MKREKVERKCWGVQDFLECTNDMPQTVTRLIKNH